MKLCGQTFDESRVGFARGTTQLMIEMANNETPITKIDELMQQSDRIAATRDADEMGCVLRKLLKNLQLEATLICSAFPHPFECKGACRAERLEINEYLTMNERSFIFRSCVSESNRTQP